MKKGWKRAKWAGLILLLIVAYAGYRIIWGHPITINQLANRQALLYLMDNPELFTQVGIADGSILDHHSGRLTEVGDAKRDRDYAHAQQYLEEVRRFDRARLDRQDQITYDVLVEQESSQLELKRFTWLSSEGLYPISPQFGTQAQLIAFMETSHVAKNGKTARNYVARLIAMGSKLSALSADMQHQAALGVVLPASLLEKSITVVGDILKSAPEQNGLVTTFDSRMKASIAQHLKNLPFIRQVPL